MPLKSHLAGGPSLAPAGTRSSCVTRAVRKNSLGFALAASAGMLSACGEPAPAVEQEPAGTLCLDNGNGFVSGELFGAVELQLSWPNAGTECRGMPRPGRGARLHFARPFDNSEAKMTLIIGIEALARGVAGNGLSANVTLIDERDSAFYSNYGVPNCWVDIFRQTEVADADSTQVDGILYCSGALAKRQGTGGVTPREIRFSGRIDWPLVNDDAKDDDT